jgi:transposase
VWLQTTTRCGLGGLRGEDRRSGSLFSYVDLEARVAADHPLRAIRAIVDDALSGLSGELEALYSDLGRPSIPPERLLRALLLQAFYSVRSERLLMEQLDDNLLYRWFVGLGIDGRGAAPTCGAGRGPGVAPDRLHHQPRPPTRGRRSDQVPGGGSQPSAGPAAPEPRPASCSSPGSCRASGLSPTFDARAWRPR